MTLYAKTSELKLNYADLENKKLGTKLMYGTGMRLNELLSLRILDIGFGLEKNRILCGQI